MPSGTLYLCVVDPGVGGNRAGLILEADGDWFLGPDNGLLSRVAHRAARARLRRIGWQPERLSASFHGRDWFAPAAARLCLGRSLGLEELASDALVGSDWADALAAVLYADRFGNLMCGLTAADYAEEGRLGAAGQLIAHARIFGEVPPGEPFWYENALGLVEIAVNQGRADRELGLAPGDPVVPPSRLRPGQAPRLSISHDPARARQWPCAIWVCESSAGMARARRSSPFRPERGLPNALGPLAFPRMRHHYWIGSPSLPRS